MIEDACAIIMYNAMHSTLIVGSLNLVILNLTLNYRHVHYLATAEKKSLACTMIYYL